MTTFLINSMKTHRKTMTDYMTEGLLTIKLLKSRQFNHNFCLNKIYIFNVLGSTIFYYTKRLRIYSNVKLGKDITCIITSNYYFQTFSTYI